MKIRLMSGTVYIALLVAFFCLKIFVPTVDGVPYGDFCFDVLIYVFALIGTFEMLRAVKDKTCKAERGIVYAFAVVAIPAVALSQWKWGNGLMVIGALALVLAVAVLSLLVVAHEKVSLESLGLSFFSAVYPALLLCLLVLTNHAVGSAKFAKFALDSRIMILFVFVVSPCADSIAYVFGKFLRKYFPKKITPVLSPNKTVIGGIGTIKAATGVAGAVIVCLIAAVPVIRMLLQKTFVEWLSVFAGILGLSGEGKLMSEIGSYLGYVSAIMAISAVFFILSLSMMATV